MAQKKRVKRKTAKRRGVRGMNPAVVSGTRRRRRKKIGYVSGSELGDVALGALAGFGIGVLGNKMIPGNDMIKGGVELAAGAGLVLVGMKKKNALMTGTGIGLGAVGALGVAKSAGIIEGMDEFMSGIGFDEMNGADDTMLIEMNGTERDVNGTNFIGADGNPAVIFGDNDGQPTIVSGGNPSVVSGF